MSEEIRKIEETEAEITLAAAPETETDRAEGAGVPEIGIGEEPSFDAPDAEMEVAIRDDRDEEADSLIAWGTARAAAIVAAPLLGTAALVANEVYMICRIGEVYGVKLADRAALSFIASLGAVVTGSFAATLIPLAIMQVPIAASVTYGVGKAARKWIKDGMPDDVGPYLAVFEEEKDKNQVNTEEMEKDPRKDEPLGDETVRFDGDRKLYPDQAHEAFSRFSGKLEEAAGAASARFIEALKKAGVTDEQIEKARFTAIGVTEVAKETALEAAKDFQAQLKVKSKEWSAQARERSKAVSAEARERSKELSGQAKDQLDVLKEKGKKLRLEADIRKAEAELQAEKARAEARIRMARARVKAAEVRVEAEAQAEEARAKAAEISSRMQALAKEYKENAAKAAAEAKENFRSAAEDFKAKAMERADQRWAEHRASGRGGDAAGDGASAQPEAEPLAEEAVDTKKE